MDPLEADRDVGPATIALSADGDRAEIGVLRRLNAELGLDPELELNTATSINLGRTARSPLLPKGGSILTIRTQVRFHTFS